MTILVTVPGAEAQAPRKPASAAEQTDFGIELEVHPVRRPVELPVPALRALSTDERVRCCFEREGLPPEELPADWFVASEIRLNGPKEINLVVLPRKGCLLGANTGQIWVLRKTADGYGLVLSMTALGLKVLPTRTNGFRDVQAFAAVGGYAHTYDHRFDGRVYRIARHSINSIGAEPPRNLAGYETRKPLIQQRGQTPEAVLAEARAWVWSRWRARKLSYLTVRTFDENKQETSTYFIAQAESGAWQVTIKVERFIWEEEGGSKSRRKVIEDKLLIADYVQRIAPTKDESSCPEVLSDTEDLAPSTYRLQFLDYGNRPVATL